MRAPGPFASHACATASDDLVAGHAHGYVAQTLADLGLAGLLLSVLTALAWLFAAIRTTGIRALGGRISTRLLRDPMPKPDWTNERIAVAALALAPIAFGLHSLIDWTWFVPGVAVAALLAAGFVAARGPLKGEREPGTVPLARGRPIPPARAGCGGCGADRLRAARLGRVAARARRPRGDRHRRAARRRQAQGRDRRGGTRQRHRSAHASSAAAAGLGAAGRRASAAGGEDARPRRPRASW